MNVAMATPEEVAEVLHTTVASLAQMRYRGEGPKFIRVGRRRILYRWTNIEEWLAESTCSRSDQ